MAIAAAAAVLPSLPPPVARRTVAWLLCTYLAWAAVDAVFCWFLASIWLLFWGLATTAIGRVACGQGCAVVTVGFKVVSVVTGVNLVLVLPSTVLLTALMIARTKKEAAATDIEATKEPAPETWFAAVRDRHRLCHSLAFGLLATMAFTLVMPIGVLVKGDSPVIGSVIFDVGALGTVMVNCFVSCPVMTVRIWRTWRMSRHALRCVCS